jgi:hypothetical protein
MTTAGKMDKVIRRLKNEAAKLGANGILLHGVGDQPGESVGAGISTETNSGDSPYGLGFGASAFFLQMSGDGVAIFVEPPKGTPPPLGVAQSNRGLTEPAPLRELAPL